MSAPRRCPIAAARALRRALAALALPAALAAQGVRVTGTTVARYVELRPFVTDSLPVEQLTDTILGDLRATSAGIIARCVPGAPFCRYTRSADDPVSTVPLTQDLEMTAWGLGRGVQLYAHVRGRAAAGDARRIWPQAEDHFDALAAYAELDRERFRARVGRQWKTSGLGFYNFDGASVLVRARRTLTVDVYGGWSLVRGLNAPLTSDALSPVEEFPPDKRAYLIGAEVRGRPTPRSAVGVLYQREIRTDRAGLYSERVSADGSLRLGRFGAVDAELSADLAAGDLNQARFRAQLPVRARGLGDRLTMVGELRRYQPFFELWTIWGAFSPVGYAEASVAALWGGAGDRLTMQLRGGWRQYEKADAGVGFLPLRTDGWRVSADASLRLWRSWLATAGARRDIGFGASRGDGDVGLRWEPADGRAFAGMRGTAFQNLYEFRVGEGRVLGAGADAGVRLRPDLRLVGDVALYRHRFRDVAPVTNWSQRRASLRLEWTLGGDPGLGGSGGGGR